MNRSLVPVAILATLFPAVAVAQQGLTLRPVTVGSMSQEYCDMQVDQGRVLVLLCQSQSQYERHMADVLSRDTRKVEDQSCALQPDGQLRCTVFVSERPFISPWPQTK